jgi:hypothetical protein
MNVLIKTNETPFYYLLLCTIGNCIVLLVNAGSIFSYWYALGIFSITSVQNRISK